MASPDFYRTKTYQEDEEEISCKRSKNKAMNRAILQKKSMNIYTKRKLMGREDYPANSSF